VTPPPCRWMWCTTIVVVVLMCGNIPYGTTILCISYVLFRLESSSLCKFIYR
jgi:hypothetical protein